MSFAAVTKPSVGDPIKLSTIESLIDNQDFFNTQIGSVTAFGADGNFETTPSGGDPAQGWTTTGDGAALAVRSSSSGDPNSSGKWTMKIGGSAGDELSIITKDAFKIDSHKAYIISVGTQVDNAGDRFEIDFISYQRDGATGPVQTVRNPIWGDSTNIGINHTNWHRDEWVVDGGLTGKWAKIKITWYCNDSTASNGYIDNLTIEPMHREVRFITPEWADSNNNSLIVYCPRYCQTEFLQTDLASGNGLFEPDGTQTGILGVTNGPSTTDSFKVNESVNPTYYADTSQKINITSISEGNAKKLWAKFTPRWTI